LSFHISTSAWHVMEIKDLLLPPTPATTPTNEG